MAASNPKWLPNNNWAWPRDVIFKLWPKSVETRLRYYHFNVGYRLDGRSRVVLNKAHYGLPNGSLLFAKCGKKSTGKWGTMQQLCNAVIFFWHLSWFHINYVGWKEKQPGNIGGMSLSTWAVIFVYKSQRCDLCDTFCGDWSTIRKCLNSLQLQLQNRTVILTAGAEFSKCSDHTNL